MCEHFIFCRSWTAKIYRLFLFRYLFRLNCTFHFIQHIRVQMYDERKKEVAWGGPFSATVPIKSFFVFGLCVAHFISICSITVILPFGVIVIGVERKQRRILKLIPFLRMFERFENALRTLNGEDNWSVEYPGKAKYTTKEKWNGENLKCDVFSEWPTLGQRTHTKLSSEKDSKVSLPKHFYCV